LIIVSHCEEGAWSELSGKPLTTYILSEAGPERKHVDGDSNDPYRMLLVFDLASTFALLSHYLLIISKAFETLSLTDKFFISWMFL
jgi:hypothetical protein